MSQQNNVTRKTGVTQIPRSLKHHLGTLYTSNDKHQMAHALNTYASL